MVMNIEQCRDDFPYTTTNPQWQVLTIHLASGSECRDNIIIYSLASFKVVCHTVVKRSSFLSPPCEASTSKPLTHSARILIFHVL